MKVLAFVAFCLVFGYSLFKSAEYTEAKCIKSGGSYEMGTWTKECKHK
jgi:hypothetical protein